MENETNDGLQSKIKRWAMENETNDGYSKINRAMRDPDQWAIRFAYQDSEGFRTLRHVSPTSWQARDCFRGLCLSRENYRLFKLNRVSDLELVPAADLTMPIEINSIS